MNKTQKTLMIILEVVQWTLIVFCLFSCLVICPNMKAYVKAQDKEKLYHKIYRDQRIDNLTQENLRLADSLSVKKTDTIYITKVRYKHDTIYIKEFVPAEEI